MNNQLPLDAFDAPLIELWHASESDKGEIFTKNQIVHFMIAASGIPHAITARKTRILEPSCGQGEFLIHLAKILCDELKKTSDKLSLTELGQKIVGYEISDSNLRVAREKLKKVLSDHFSENDSNYLVESWLRHEDFLLAECEGQFSHVIGNPPYIRVENIPKPILSLYRQKFPTMSDRADIYIGFFEKGLQSLAPGGKLSFICTDRWIKNQYGRKLRALIDSGRFNVDYYLDLFGKDPFHRKVLTYPAITQISRNQKSRTLVVQSDSACPIELFNTIETKTKPKSDLINAREDIGNGESPWLLGNSSETAVVQRLERQFPSLEEAGCKIFIGAATGNNKVFVVDEDVDIEFDRKVPLVTAKDIRTGAIVEGGQFLINTYDEDGVVDLDDYPKLKKYLTKHKDALSSRHVAKTQPQRWYKTIDRVYPERAKREKLLIPDIKSNLTVIHENGRLHPNNSLYYICSDTWDLRALQAVLLAGIGRLFIETYSTKVANGFLRFQSQHLRRICIPHWENLHASVRDELIKAGETNNHTLAVSVVKDLYNITDSESELIGI